MEIASLACNLSLLATVKATATRTTIPQSMAPQKKKKKEWD
jgi:hypothetical protein